MQTSLKESSQKPGSPKAGTASSSGMQLDKNETFRALLAWILFTWEDWHIVVCCWCNTKTLHSPRYSFLCSITKNNHVLVIYAGSDFYVFSFLYTVSYFAVRERCDFVNILLSCYPLIEFHVLFNHNLLNIQNIYGYNRIL